MLFGLVPAVAGGLLWVALSDQPLAAGFTAPPLARALVLHVLLWGGLLGLMCARWVNPPTSADVGPE
jgi:hypothetical protein